MINIASIIYENKKYQNIVILVSFCLFAALVRLTFISPLGTGDEINYANTALNIIDGKPFIHPHHFALRVGVIFPASICMMILGVSKTALFLWSFLCSLASIILVYFCAKKYFKDQRTAIISSLLYTIIPLNTIYATSLTPEPVTEFFSLLAFLFYLIAKENRLNKAFIKRYMALFSCGLSIGLGYLAKEPMILVLFVFGVFAILDFFEAKKIYWDYSLIVLGFLLIFISEQLVYYIYTGKWLYRLNAVSADAKIMLSIVEHEKQEARMSQYIRYMFLSIYQTGIFFYLFFVSVIFLSFKKILPLRLMLWFTIVYIYLQFGSASLKNFMPLPKLAKYLSIINPPLVLIISCFLSKINKYAYGFVILIAIVSSILCIAFTNIVTASPASKFSGPVAGFIMKHPSGKFYMDHRFGGTLKFLTHGRVADDRFVSYTYFDYSKGEKGKINFAPSKGDWIIIGKEEYFRPSKGVILEYPQEVLNKPDNWKEEACFRTSQSRILAIMENTLSLLEKIHAPKFMVSKAKDTVDRVNKPKEVYIYQIR